MRWRVPILAWVHLRAGGWIDALHLVHAERLPAEAPPSSGGPFDRASDLPVVLTGHPKARFACHRCAVAPGSPRFGII